MRKDGTYHVLGRDPITEVFGKEHGGRTKGVPTVLGVRTALGWVKGDKERHHVVDVEAITENVTKTVTAAFQDKFDCQKSEMEGLKAIDPAPWDLQWPYRPEKFRVAIGKVYPTRDATLHGSSMSEGHIKVEQPMSSHPSTTKPVEPKQTQEDRIKERLKKNQEKDKIRSKPDKNEKHFFCYQCTCKFCGNGAHVGYNCSAQVPSVQTLPSFPQQSPCCEDFGVTREPYQCQPKNHAYYNEQNSCFDSNSFGFDQSQPQQYSVNHPIFTAHNDCLDSQIQLNKEKQLEEEQAAKAQNWKLPVCYDDDDNMKRSNSLKDNLIFGLPPCSAITPNEPVLSTGEPDNSLSMGDEHLDTIPVMESDQFIKSGVENLIPIPSESEGIPDHMCDVPSHDISPPLDVSKDQIEDFSESTEEFSSTDDDSFSSDDIDYVEASPPDSELVSLEVMEIVILEVGGINASNDNPIPFHDPIIPGNPPNLTPSGESDFFLEVDAFLAVEDESTSSQFPKLYLDPEGDMLLFEAFLNDDHSSDFQTKSSSTSLNSLLEETNNFHNSLPEFTTFSNDPCDAECESDSSNDQSSSDEDILKKIVSKPMSEEEIIPMESLRTHDSSLLISSKIDSLLDEFADIRLIEKMLYDNSSPCPPEEFVYANPDAAIKSFSPSPILVKDSDSLMEEIDLFCTPDYPMPPGIVDEDYDSERDILIHKNLPSNNSLSFAEKESFYFDIPPFSRPPAKPPDGDTGILNIKMMGDIYDQKDFMHKLMITLASHQEKSPDLLSHRCGTVKKFNTHRSHLNTCPMLINGQNNPPLDVLLFHFYPP
nr:ulp1 protease family, C-terminal catalytic domain-containing protein [Tanacetum cinerariifolium]